MKKIVCFSLCLVLLASFSTIATAYYDPYYPYIGQGTVTANNVELRSGPGPAYSSGGQVHSGNSFVIRDIQNGGWLHVDMTSGPNANQGGFIACCYASYYFYPSPQTYKPEN